MILLIDIGNSTSVIASYDGQVIQVLDSLQTSSFDGSFQDIYSDIYQGIVVSSVVPDKANVFEGLSNVVFVDHLTDLGISLDVDMPEQVGADRLVNAAAAYKEYGGPVLVVDSGTAITCCYVDSDGVYQGGAIFPGMGIASKALNDYTAKIPLIYVSEQKKLFGKSTKEAVEVGLYQGYLALMRGMVQSYRESYPGIKVVGTGSGLELFQDHIGLDVFDSELIFKGLASIASRLLKV